MSTSPTAHPITRRLAATLGLLILLAAPPAVLVALLGNPLPDWSAISAGDWGGDTLPRILACIAWLGWAQLALGILLEAVAAGHGRTAPHIALGQGLARALILTIMTASIGGPLLGTAVTARAAPVENTPPRAPAPVTAPAVSGHVSAPAQRPAATHHPVYVVGSEHDVAPRLWTIAARHLGDPLRWREIRDLNLARTMSDGRVFHDADLIRIGWHLLMPVDATGLPPASSTEAGGAEPAAADQRPATDTVTRGENLTEIAREHHVPVQKMWEANRGHEQPGGRTFTDPNLIYPHQKLVVPLTDHAAAPHADSPAQRPDHKPAGHQPTGQPPAPNVPAPTTSVPSAPPVTPSATQPAGPPAAAHSATPGQQHDDAAKASSSSSSSTSAVLPAALATFGGAGCLLAAGIVLRLRRGRGRQQRHRGYRRLIPVPDGAHADIEFAAATAADPVDVDWLDEGLRVLGCALAASPGSELPNIAAVYLHCERLELVLADPAPTAPAPFFAEQNGALWTLTKSAAAAADLPTAAVLPPAPALATVGLTRDQDGRPERLVLLDIEGIGSISIAGEPSHVGDLLRFMAGDLAYNGWSVGVHVIACGMGPDLSSLAPDRIRCVSDIAALREHLLADEVFRPAGNPLAERVHNEYGDAWLTPRVVLLAGCDTDDDIAAISTLLADLHAAGRSLLGVVIAGDHPDAHWHARLDPDGRLHLPDLSDLVVEAQTLPADLVDALGDTIEQAESAADTPAPPSTLNAPWAQGTDVVGGLLPATAGATYPEAPVDQNVDVDLDHADQDVDQSEPDAVEATAVAGQRETEALVETSDAASAGDSLDQAPLGQPALAPVPAVRSLRPELDQARRALLTREALDPTLDADLARFLDPPAHQGTASILGPISVTAAGPRVPSKIASEAQATEFLLYLKLSENGKTGAEIGDELFAGHAAGPGGVRRDQIRKIMGALREWLGVDADGTPYLPSATSVKPPRYLITDSLLLDWHLLIRLRARAQARAAAEHTEAAIADYRAALSLVRGRPFAARRVEGYRWLVYCGGLEHHVLSGVVDTAHELAVLGMDAGDGELVDFATTASMTADPYGALNQPYADRLRWQMMLGNKDRFSEIVRELIEVRSQNSEEEIGDLDIDGEPGVLINEFLGREGLRVLGN